MATVVMIAIGVLILAAGALLMFLNVTKRGFAKNLKASSRGKLAVIAVFLMIVGVMFIILNFI